MGIFVRSLVLCNAFLLALPQGWCCFVPVPSACPNEAPANAKCSHCSRDVKHEPSAPTPEPAKPDKVCCCQSDTLAGLNAEKFQLDPGLVAPVSAAADIPLPNRSAEIARCHLLSPPLHLVHCVWLC